MVLIMRERMPEEAIRCMIKPHDALEDVLYLAADNNLAEKYQETRFPEINSQATMEIFENRLFLQTRWVPKK